MREVAIFDVEVIGGVEVVIVAGGIVNVLARSR
jgi:hypothetical protein